MAFFSLSPSLGGGKERGEEGKKEGRRGKRKRRRCLLFSPPLGKRIEKEKGEKEKRERRRRFIP